MVWWATKQDAPRFPSSARDLWPLAAAIGIYAAATLVRGWRWHLILRRAGVAHARADAIALVAVGYMGNAVFPARGGEVLRVVLLAPRTDSRRREVLGTIVAERLLDLLTLIALFAAITWSGVAGTPTGRGSAAAAVGAVVAGVAAVGVYLRVRRSGRLHRFADAVRPVVHASRMLVGRTGVELAALSLGIWLLEGSVYFLVAQALNLHVDYVGGVFLVALAAFFAVIPAAPGYVGTFDAAIVFGLRALKIKGGQAVAFALLVRFVVFVPVTVAGLILVLTRYGGLRGLRRRAAENGDEIAEQPVPVPGPGPEIAA